MDMDQVCTELRQQVTDDPVGVAQFCGQVMGELILNTEHFSLACGIAWVNKFELPRRIDFLFSQGFFYPRNKNVFRGNIKWTCDALHRLEIEDKGGAFGRMHILISPIDPDYPTHYAIQDATATGSGPDQIVMWSFDANEGITVDPMSSGFNNLQRTKWMVLLIKWFTNVLGFGRQRA